MRFINAIAALRKSRRGARLATSLTNNGTVTIRRFLGSSDAARLKRVVDETYRTASAVDQFDDATFEKNLRGWNGVWIEGLPGFLSAHNPVLAERYAEIEQLICSSTASLLGARWRIYRARSYFRQQRIATSTVPWHIDADAAAIDAEECINVWLPLDKVGVDLPSLDVVPGSHRKMRALPKLPTETAFRDEAFVASVGAIETPIMDLGDALVCDQYTLHRTQRVGATNMIRTSCEFRFRRTSLPA